MDETGKGSGLGTCGRFGGLQYVHVPLCSFHIVAWSADSSRLVPLNIGLSPIAKFPACRDDFLAAYSSLLNDHGIEPKRIVFGGDSAGGGLVAMSALHAPSVGLPPPRSMLMLSPWLDLTVSHTLRSPALYTDYLVGFSNANQSIIKQLLPADVRADSPLVSPVLDNLRGLPPQLILAGTAEVLLPDSEDWERRSAEAGNAVKLIREDGQMHM